MTRTLDEQVAHVLGWRQDDLGEQLWTTPDGGCVAHVAAYSTDPAEFVRLLEWAAAQGFDPALEHTHGVTYPWSASCVASGQTRRVWHAQDTPFLALAKAIAGTVEET